MKCFTFSFFHKAICKFRSRVVVHYSAKDFELRLVIRGLRLSPNDFASISRLFGPLGPVPAGRDHAKLGPGGLLISKRLGPKNFLENPPTPLCGTGRASGTLVFELAISVATFCRPCHEDLLFRDIYIYIWAIGECVLEI